MPKQTPGPSVPIHGNYHGYYTKRGAYRDSRLNLLPTNIFLDARVLDIGCNEGWVTCEVGQSWGAKEVIGVDIDDTLIRAAWKRRRSVWSQQQPAKEPPDASSLAPFKKRKIDGTSASSLEINAHPLPHYFPAAFEHMFGPLQLPSGRDDKSRANLFPHNVTFRTTNWVKDGALEDRDGYNVVLALSITKWIHLNDGDEGLLGFFRRVFSVLKAGGAFILEPQEWETYAKAKRMDPKLKENAGLLKLRPNDFERILVSLGFLRAEHLGVTGEGGFQRPLLLLKKPALKSLPTDT